MKILLLLLACLFVAGCNEGDSWPKYKDGSDPAPIGPVITVKSEGPFGTMFIKDKATLQAIEAAASDPSKTAASDERYHEVTSGQNVKRLFEDADVQILEGNAGADMRVVVRSGDKKGLVGWLLPNAHFR